MRLKYIFLFFLAVLLASSCREDDITTSEVEISPNPLISVETSLNGLVSDLEGNPLDNVTVNYRGENLTTDENGYFKLENIEAVFDGGMARFSKDGFLDNYKWFYPQQNDIAFLRVILVEESGIGTLNPSSGGTFTMNGGATVTFPAGDIFEDKLTGEALTPTNIQIYGHWYDPTDDKLAEVMPGDLRAINSEEQLVQLSTYGMVYVEMRDGNRELQLRDGVEAELSFPLPEPLNQTSSETIQTWSFDEELAYWIEEGTAELVDNRYVAQVSHFSFWNCDAPFPVVHITGRIVNSLGTPLPNVKVCITDLSRANTRMGWTSYNGVFSGKIPKDELLKISIKDECGNTVLADEIGPFSEDVNVGDLEYTGTGDFLISGTLQCDGRPVSNGYALLVLNNGITFIAETDPNGRYEISIIACENSKISIKGFDEDSNTTSADFTIFENFGSELDAGIIQVCDELEEFLTVKEFGSNTNTEFFNRNARLENNQLIITGADIDSTRLIEFRINNIQLGPNQLSFFNLDISPNQFSCQNADCNDLEVNIKELDLTIGGIVEGEITSVSEQLSICFKIRLSDIRLNVFVRGRVWEDLDSDGIRSNAENMALSQGQIVAINVSNGQTATTQINDNYALRIINPGTYEFFVDLPNGYEFSPEKQGGDDTIDSDVNPVTGSFSLTIDGTVTAFDNYDIGLHLGDDLCQSTVLQQPSCSSPQGGTIQLFVIGGDSTLFNGFPLRVFNDGVIVEEFPFLPFAIVDGLEEGLITYEVTDPNSGDIVCSGEQQLTANNDIMCDIYPFIDCFNNEMMGGLEFSCEYDPVTIEWFDGSTDFRVPIPSEGEYALTITDDTGCSQEFVVLFDEEIRTIGGVVWSDNPIYDDNEYDVGLEDGIPGLTVNLYDVANLNNILDTRVTDMDGRYSFERLMQGEYILEVIPPAGREFVEKQDPNVNDFLDSDVDPSTGRTDVLEVGCTSFNSTHIGIKQ